jgi:hypothetical protein
MSCFLLDVGFSFVLLLDVGFSFVLLLDIAACCSCCYSPCLVFPLSVTACNFSCCYSCSDIAAYLGSLCRVIPYRPGYGLFSEPNS